jgi:hypothetical protein
VAEFLIRIVFALALGVVIGVPAGGIAFVYQLAAGQPLSEAGRMAGRVVIRIMDSMLEQI